MTPSSTMDLNLIDCRRYTTEDGKIIVKLSKKSKRKIASTTPELRQSTTTRKFYAFYRAYIFLPYSIQQTTKIRQQKIQKTFSSHLCSYCRAIYVRINKRISWKARVDSYDWKASRPGLAGDSLVIGPALKAMSLLEAKNAQVWKSLYFLFFTQQNLFLAFTHKYSIT